MGASLNSFVQGETPDGSFGQEKECEEIIIDVESISTGYFHYLKTNFQSAGIENAFGSPTNVFSNVRAGYGLVAAYAGHRIRVYKKF